MALKVDGEIWCLDRCRSQGLFSFEQEWEVVGMFRGVWGRGLSASYTVLTLVGKGEGSFPRLEGVIIYGVNFEISLTHPLGGGNVH